MFDPVNITLVSRIQILLVSVHVQCTSFVVQISVRKLKSLNNFPNKVYIFLEKIKFISEKYCRKVVTLINWSDINTRSGGAPPN